MEPTNQPQRKTAIGKFFGIYALSLIFPVGAVYMLTAVPDAMSSSEAAKYRKIVEEQTPVVTNADTLGSFAKQLLRQDGLSVSSPDPAVKGEANAKITQLESQIKASMNDIRAQLIQQPENQPLSRGVSSMAEVIVALRSNMSSLRMALDKQGIDVGAINKLQSEIQLKDMDISSKQNMIQTLTAQLAASGGAAKSGGGSAPDPMIPILQRQVAQYKQQIADQSSAAKGGDQSGTITTLRQQLEECNNKPKTSGGGTVVQGIMLKDALDYAQAEGFAQLAFIQTNKQKQRYEYFDKARDIFNNLSLTASNADMRSKAKARAEELIRNESKIP